MNDDAAALHSYRPVHCTMERLLSWYHTLAFDAVGVLMSGGEIKPNVSELFERMNATGHHYFVVSNLCTGSDQKAAQRLYEAGIPIRDTSQVISAGGLVRAWMEKNVNSRVPIAYVGTAEAAEALRLAEHQLRDPRETMDFEMLLVLDDENIPIKEVFDAVLTRFVKCHKNGRRPPSIVVGNPDCVYPRGNDQFAFGPGVIEVMLRRTLQKTYGWEPEVVTIGKPGPVPFLELRHRAWSDDIVFIGDQLGTDIAGAAGVGLHTALVETGVNSAADVPARHSLQPEYILERLDL